MKTGISAIWLVGLVITFLMIFSAYIIITVDYSKTFKLKNEVLTIIEKNKGMTIYNGVKVNSTIKRSEKVLANVGAVKTINAFLAGSGYTAKGPCDIPKGTTYIYGVKYLKFGQNDGWGNIGESAKKGEEYYYCFAKYPTGRLIDKNTGKPRELYKSVYYRVELFYKFEIPILREFLPIRVDGVTDEIYRPASDSFSENSRDYFTAVGGY